MNNLTERDAKVLWHPYTHIKTAGLPLPIVKAKGAYLYAENGDKYIDAISSWWVNTHGHCHPYIAQKVHKQLKQLDHVIFAGFTHPTAIELAERLLRHLPENQNKIFFSDNGSTAVEVAVKMALQYFYNKGKTKNKIIALKNAYHGDTFGAMSVSGESIFTAPFKDLTFEVLRVETPVKNKEKEAVSQLKKLLIRKDVAAFIFEPLVLGAGGMLMCGAAVLDEMIALCKKHHVLTIADEVMTGFFRTGRFFASDFLKYKPDIFCLSKGITGGTMPLGVTSCTEIIHQAFVDDDVHKTLYHGHSYTANPVACSAALASMDLYERKTFLKNILRIEVKHNKFVKTIKAHDALIDVRQQGTIVALDLKTDEETTYTNKIRQKISVFFRDKKILIRPLGNVLYLMPPYCISNNDLDYIYGAVGEFLESLNEDSLKK